MSPLKIVKDKRFKAKKTEKLDISRILKEHRNKYKLSQEDFANEVGLSRQIIARWETNYSYPSNLSIKLLKLKKII